MHEPPPVLETRSGEGIIYLDLETDEYSCRYDCDILVDEYYRLTTTQFPVSTTLAPRAATTSWSDLPQCDRPTCSLKDMAWFVVALGNASIRFRGKSVRELSGIAGALGRGRAERHASIQEVACIFDRLLAMLPVQPECLFRSFFLLHFLDLYGLRADWVFGVQLFPFRAHCWVACENELLNEVSHAIEDYQIIYRTGQAEG